MAAAMELRGHKRYLRERQQKRNTEKKALIYTRRRSFYTSLSLSVYNTPRYITQVVVCVFYNFINVCVFCAGVKRKPLRRHSRYLHRLQRVYDIYIYNIIYPSDRAVHLSIHKKRLTKTAVTTTMTTTTTTTTTAVYIITTITMTINATR